MYIKRFLESAFLDALKQFPVVAITGPRQSGKSTMLEQVLGSEYQIVRMDQPENRALFYDDPKSFMSNHPDKVVFDEAQLVPELFEYIKLAVDADRGNYGKFVLSGSQQFHLLKGISESLAGRVANLRLLPLQCIEVPDTLRNASVWQGAYPELVNNAYQNKKLWFSSYIETYLEKDVRAIHNIGDLRDFQRFVQLLAGNVSGQLNMSHYARDIGVAVSTIQRWVSILEASYIIFLVQPFYENFGKRIVKSPKVYFYDTGLVSHLVGIEMQEHYEKGPMCGAIFENYVVSEILKKELHGLTHKDIYYFRAHGGDEVDLILDSRRHKQLIEIKHSQSFKPKMLAHVSKYMQEGDEGCLLYSGESKPYKAGIKLINFQDFLLSDQ